MIQISKNIGVLDDIWSMSFKKDPMPSFYNDYPFLIFENLLTNDECQHIIDSFKDYSYKAMLKGSGLNEDIRKTKLLKLTATAKDEFERAISKVKNRIEEFFNVRLFGGSSIQALYYEDGGFYRCHADNASEIVKNNRLIDYKIVANNRKITTLLFLNDDFSGGEIEFCHLRYNNNRGVIFKPKEGMLIAFASHPIFAHEVREVKGKRYSLVKWWNAL